MKDNYNFLLHTKVAYDKTNPSLTPIFQVSGYEVDSDIFYARKEHPNANELEDVFSLLENAKFSLLVNSGMSAIQMCLQLLKPNQRVLLSDKIYGCTYKLFQKYCQKHQVKLDICDFNSQIIVELTSTYKYDLCFFETPTNPFLKTIDIQYVSNLCKSANPQCYIIVDNTWATAIYQQPLNLGASISLSSCSKYYGGHSDLLGGIISVNDVDLYQELFDIRFYSGLILPPFPSWLLKRSMQTLIIRLEQQIKTGKYIKNKLESFHWIKKIYFPEIDKVQLKNYGGIFFIEITDKKLKDYKNILDNLKLFGTGTGMACTTSMIAQPYYGSHASLTTEEKNSMGITPNLIRLCFGLEKKESLLADLIHAFK